MKVSCPSVSEDIRVCFWRSFPLPGPGTDSLRSARQGIKQYTCFLPSPVEVAERELMLPPGSQAVGMYACADRRSYLIARRVVLDEQSDLLSELIFLPNPFVPDPAFFDYSSNSWTRVNPPFSWIHTRNKNAHAYFYIWRRNKNIFRLPGYGWSNESLEWDGEVLGTTK